MYVLGIFFKRNMCVDQSTKYLFLVIKCSPSDLHLSIATLDTGTLTNILNESLNNGNVEAPEEED